MSTDLSAATGALFPLTLGGKTYQSRPITAAMWGEVHNCLLAKRTSVLEETARKIGLFPKEIQADVLKAAMEHASAPAVIGKSTLQGYLESWEGTLYILWLMLRQDAPELKSTADVLPLVQDIPLAVLSKMVAVAGGLDAAKNLSGPAATNPTAP